MQFFPRKLDYAFTGILDLNIVGMSSLKEIVLILIIYKNEYLLCFELMSKESLSDIQHSRNHDHVKYKMNRTLDVFYYFELKTG